jgi:hypothetical protein
VSVGVDCVTNKLQELDRSETLVGDMKSRLTWITVLAGHDAPG